jgi:hypothetical protein
MDPCPVCVSTEWWLVPMCLVCTDACWISTRPYAAFSEVVIERSHQFEVCDQKEPDGAWLGDYVRSSNASHRCQSMSHIAI